MENKVYADVPVSASVTHARQASADDIIAEAEEIHKKVLAAKLKDDDAAGQEALLKRIQDEHRDFNVSFPLMLRWTVQTRQYRRTAFARYLTFMKGKEWKDRKDFLRDQGEYLVILYKELHHKYDSRQVAQYRQAIVAQLLKEDEEFEAMKKEAESELERKNKDIDQERRRNLYAYLMKQKVAQEQQKAAAQPASASSAATQPTAIAALAAKDTAEADKRRASFQVEDEDEDEIDGE